MRPEAIKEFQTRNVIEQPDTTPSVVLENLRSKNIIEVPGKHLEAQYRVGDNFLLLVTEGNPLEEALYIYYLNNDLRIIDALELSAMYTSGIFKNLSTADSDTIQFSFFETGERWILEILPSSKYIVWSNKYPVKRRSPMLHKRWLKLIKA